MALTNFETKEIHCKIVYFGMPGAGKTANLQSIFKSTSSEVQSGLLELKSDEGSTRFFDFLPLSMGKLRDFHLKIHIYTVPTSTVYQTLPSVILKGIDGYVFVVDSRTEQLAENVSCQKKFTKLLHDEGIAVTDLPRVIQYNKRDLTQVLPKSLLQKELNTLASPEIDAVAIQGVGVIETLQALTAQITDRIQMGQQHS
jgi:signal recognition particle receptor subunit beta